jgi:hypothetical protein
MMNRRSKCNTPVQYLLTEPFKTLIFRREAFNGSQVAQQGRGAADRGYMGLFDQ